MSIVVKPWKPSEGCKSCKAAKRIMDEQMRHSGEMHGRYMKKIREVENKFEHIQMKDHEIAELVNALTTIAQTYGQTQQLREHISREVCMRVKRSDVLSDRKEEQK